MRRIEDATRIRRRILIAFERAELATDEAERQRLLTFAIVGGGATGVEMAGAISEIARQTLAMDFRRIDPTTARIALIEAGPRIMPGLPQNLSDYVRRTPVALPPVLLPAASALGRRPHALAGRTSLKQ
jgi:NADH:ubiquinone reductase (H+-translocating)